LPDGFSLPDYVLKFESDALLLTQC